MSVKSEWINGTSLVCKFFSHKLIDDQLVNLMFDETSQVYRRDVDAYPVLGVKDADWSVDVEAETRGVFYVNGMEEWISTMETESVSGWNVANALISRLK
jgi:prenylcysteine oxidase/farnesylcysteine lyase